MMGLLAGVTVAVVAGYFLGVKFIYHFAYLLPAIAGGVYVLVSEGERLFGATPEPEANPANEPATSPQPAASP